MVLTSTNVFQLLYNLKLIAPSSQRAAPHPSRLSTCPAAKVLMLCAGGAADDDDGQQG